MEAARQAAAQAEAARLAAAQAEAARLAAAQAEAARLEALRIEAARRAAQQVPVQPVGQASGGTTAPTGNPNLQQALQQPQGGFTNLPFRNAFQNLFRPGGLRQVQVEEAPAPAGASDNVVEGSSSNNQ